MLSRVADSLYWLSRYLERAEHTTRLTSVYFDLILDQSSRMGGDRYQRLLKNIHATEYQNLPFDEETTISLLVLDRKNPWSVVSSINQARENARQVREQISSELWMQINQLYLMMSPPYDAWENQPQMLMQQLIQHLYQIGGIADATMSHNEGWQFMQLGRYSERANSILRLVDIHFEAVIDRPPQAEDHMDWIALLKSCTAFEAYCNVYTADLTPARIAEFLLLNAEFPHSLHFSINMMRQALKQIAIITQSHRNQELNRRAGRLQSVLQFSQIDEVLADGLHDFLKGIQQQSQAIHDTVYQVYITFPVVEELPI